MSNIDLFRQFKQLATDPLLVGDVESVFAGGAVVVLPDGMRMNVVGDATVGLRVFVRGGAIQGQAPNLPLVTVIL